MKIILASGNQGKISEINEILAGLDIQVVAQNIYNVPEADETGLTFVENAIIKARNACHYSGLPAIADDSGIEVDYLQGAPGIYSARFAGEGKNSQDNNNKLLDALRHVPESARMAKFRCVAVFLRHEKDPSPIICQGTWEGRIALAACGQGGFGYDPIFHVPSYNCTAAELPPQVKHQLSHRGQALVQLKQDLRKTR